jgi:hypothetical protein
MGVHSKVWGQYLWRLLHALTYSYNPKMNAELKAKYVRLFHVLKDAIPCPICRNHYTGRCNRNPPEKNMQTTDTFVIWLSNIHNEVNSALGKPQVGKRESDNQYVKNGKLNFDFKDFVILFRIITMINYVNFPAIQKLIQLVFDIYPDKVFLKNAPNSYKSINTIQNNQTLNTWITYFDAEFAKNRKTQPYLNTPNIIPRIVEEPPQLRQPVKNLTQKQYDMSKIVKNDIDIFLKKYKII